MTSHHRQSRISALAVLLASLLLAACSVGSAEISVLVTGDNDTCTIASDVLNAGTIDFEFINKSNDVSELYVLRANGDVVGEVENVTTGTTRTLRVDLVAGEYQVRCKPGQTGDGFSSSFSVTGDGGTVLATAERTITFDAIDFTYENLDLSDITAGETIRFEMTNKGDQPHEFEVIGPDGEALGEVGAVAPGVSGGATITFDEPGAYIFQCILIEPNSNLPHTTLGMLGDFEVGAP